MLRPLTDLSFDDDFVRSLPGDPSSSNQPRQVSGVAYSPVQPTPVAAPRLLAEHPEAAAAQVERWLASRVDYLKA